MYYIEMEGKPLSKIYFEGGRNVISKWGGTPCSFPSIEMATFVREICKLLNPDKEPCIRSLSGFQSSESFSSENTNSTVQQETSGGYFTSF